MTALSIVADLARRGVRLEVAGDQLRFHPRSALSGDDVERLRAHKLELLEILTNEPAKLFDATDNGKSTSPVAPGIEIIEHDGQSIKPATDAADEPLERYPLDTTPCDRPEPVCRCGSTETVDVLIHGGRSTRRDCAWCGRFVAFIVWYGKSTGI